MKNFKKNILKYLIELLIVAFGVFLGLFVSDWDSSRKTRQNAQKSLKYIVQELETNRENLAKTLEYHQRIRDNLQGTMMSLTEEDFMSPYFGSRVLRFSDVKGWEGVGLNSFDEIAFESAKISGILQEIEIDKVQLIAAAYDKIELTRSMGKVVLDKMFEVDSSTKIVDAIGILELLTTDVFYAEQKLYGDLEEMIQQIKG